MRQATSAVKDGDNRRAEGPDHAGSVGSLCLDAGFLSRECSIPFRIATGVRVNSLMAKPMRYQSFFYAKAAPSAAAVPVNTAHQPKTMASAVPRFTLPTRVKPMAVRISVQIRKISNEEARL